MRRSATVVQLYNSSRGESRKQYFIGEPGHRGYTSPERLEFGADRPRRAQDSGIEFTVACRIRIQQLNNISSILSYLFAFQTAFRAYLDAVDMRAAQVCDGNYTVNYVEKQFCGGQTRRARYFYKVQTDKKYARESSPF